MWEEDPRYQAAQYRLVAGLLLAATALLAAMSWYIDEWAPFRAWMLWILALELAWLAVAAAAYGVFLLWSRFTGRHAKSSARPRDPD